MMYQEPMEKLSIQFTSGDYEREVLEAKKEFFGDFAVEDKESTSYEQWVNLFFDWYLLTRPLSKVHLPPCRLFLDSKDFESLGGEEKNLFEELAQSKSGVLQFIKLRRDTAYFKNLLDRQTYKLYPQPYMVTFTKGDVCSVHMIPDLEKGIYSLTEGFCIHPAEAQSFILKEIKTLKKVGEQEKKDFQIHLVRMFFKMEQYKHLKCHQVYTKKSQVRF